MVAGTFGPWERAGWYAVVGSIDAEVTPDREAQGDLHSGLNGRSADLAVALRRVGVPDREQRPLHADRQVEGGAGPKVLGVHIAAPARGGYDRVRSRLRGGQADGAGERFVGKLDALGEDHPAPCGLDAGDAQPRLGELVGQEPEAGDERRPSPVPRPELKDLDGEHVSRPSILNVNGSADRVDVLEVELGDVL